MVRIACLVAAVALACGLAGCDSVMTGLVGKPHGPQGMAKSKPPASPFGLSFATNDVNSDSKVGSTETILPPTVPATPLADATEDTEPVGTAGPCPPIAVAPFTEEPAQLSALGAAAARQELKGETRFVLLVLSPPTGAGGSVAKTSAQSRAAANAAMKAITAAGVDPAHVELSAATSPTAGPGEMRLYVR